MNSLDEKICQQLCAYMDGELPESEMRFLQRRLEHDAELRAKWERMQMAADCLKGHPLRPMAGNLCERIDAGIRRDQAPAKRQRSPMGWAVAASVAALAMVLTPALLHHGSRPSASVAVNAALPVNPVASPGSADLVAMPAAASATAASPPVLVSSVPPAATGAAAILASTDRQGAAQRSPMPLSAQSPSDFPLIENGDKKGWPRSGLPGMADDPALEAYLVRHNQMVADDGLGGFVPYVDVVANNPSTFGDNGDSDSSDETGGQ